MLVPKQEKEKLMFPQCLLTLSDLAIVTRVQYRATCSSYALTCELTNHVGYTK
jgi:hypothetical protein